MSGDRVTSIEIQARTQDGRVLIHDQDVDDYADSGNPVFAALGQAADMLRGDLLERGLA